MRIVFAKLSRDAFNPLVVALVYPGLASFEYLCAAEVFGGMYPELGQPLYRFETAAMEGPGGIPAAHGLKVVPDHGLDRLPEAGTVVIPGWTENPATPVPCEILAALRAASARGARIVSICTGAFVLAATGLLDGRRATTHWRYAGLLQDMYPPVRVDSDVLYVDEGLLLTSAGSAAAMDLCLHLVRKDHGAQAANCIARSLVVAPHRDGGQAQFIDRPVPPRENSRLTSVLEQMLKMLDMPLTVPQLAQMAAMSERTFLRRFREATGLTPSGWLRVARLERARQLLEETSKPVEIVAQECGFGTANTLRVQFRDGVGVSPIAYRRRFGLPAQVDGEEAGHA